MIKISTIDDWAKKVDELIPDSVKELDRGIEEKVKSLLSSFARELDVATREEFDIQSKVLLKTRMKLEALEARLDALESNRKTQD